VKRETKKRLSAKDLRELGADPDRMRRVLPPDGSQRAEVRKSDGGTKKGGAEAPGGAPRNGEYESPAIPSLDALVGAVRLPAAERTGCSNEAARRARGLFCLLACVSVALFLAASCAEERGERQRTEPRTHQRTEPPTRQRDEARTYRLDGLLHQQSRATIDKSGAKIGEVGKRYAVVTATRRQIRDIAGAEFFAIRERADRDPSAEGRTIDGFPPEDSAYHDYEEMSAEVRRVADANPAIVRRFSLGESYEGRDLWAVKISDDVAADEDEPEVLFVGLHHAREHLSVEMALYTLHLFADNYGTDPRIRGIVDSREVYVVFALDPDGGEYDIADGYYHAWRKNRQPNGGSTHTGTDLNRNYGYGWGCCGGSSGDPASRFYRGSSAFSAPETARLRDFVDGRVVDGEQQIETAIDFHSYGEIITWPYGYTLADVPSDMAQDDHDAFVAMGEAMSATLGYTPLQPSDDSYISDGSMADWAYGVHGIFAYSFEMYPKGPKRSFYPPDETIASETERNREAVLYIAEQADCPYRSIGKEAQHCAPA
jgi:carboxypeptidase T